jgi:hypothetical protein
MQRLSILVVIDVTVPNCFPHVPHLEPYPHRRGPLDVVGLGEGRPPAAGTDVPDNGLDPMVTMVLVRGGRVAPPVKAAISVNPVVGASAPIWAAAAVGGTAAARTPARSAADASMPVWAAATALLGVRGCPLRCLPYQLELVVSVVVTETELSVLLARKASSSAAAARAASTATAASTSALAAVSFTIASLASLAAVVVVSAAARSHSSAAATSASCRCCALEATEC